MDYVHFCLEFVLNSTMIQYQVLQSNYRYIYFKYVLYYIYFLRDDLCQLIVKRIGLETFFDKLSSISKNENYSQAGQKPQPKHKKPDNAIFNYEFCRLFKSLEGKS